jgi:ribosomal protein S12 methylthiotransferase accessory factor
MEKRQYKDFHIPFAADKLIKPSELLEEAIGPAGNYNSRNESERALKFLYSQIMQTGENLTGPTFSFNESTSSYPVLHKWQPVINYLREKKLIDNVIFEPLYYDEPKLVRTITDVFGHDISSLTDGSLPKSGYTHGDSYDLEESISKVIGELLERFPLLIYREKDFIRSSVGDFEKKGKILLDIKRLAGFSEEQKTRTRIFQYNEENDFLWAEGRSLFSGRSVLMPAQLIYWNYITKHKNWQEPTLREVNTNGAAGHYTLAEAILSGLYELIQRDGFLIYWLNNQAPPRIDLSTIEYEPLKKLLQECERWNLEVHFFNVTSELNVPSCICAVFDHSGIGTKLSMGGGCGLVWEKMLFRSLIEATGVYHFRRKRTESGEKIFSLKSDYEPFFDRSIGQFERLALWSDEKIFPHFQFFMRGEEQSVKELGKKSIKFSSAEKELEYLTEKFRLLGKDYEIFYYQASHEVLKDLGYYSVKVIVPALIPLYLREIYAPLGAGRLKEVPEKLGFKPSEKWNPWPHPFP